MYQRRTSSLTVVTEEQTTSKSWVAIYMCILYQPITKVNILLVYLCNNNYRFFNNAKWFFTNIFDWIISALIFYFFLIAKTQNVSWYLINPTKEKNLDTKQKNQEISQIQVSTTISTKNVFFSEQQFNSIPFILITSIFFRHL